MDHSQNGVVVLGPGSESSSNVQDTDMEEDEARSEASFRFSVSQLSKLKDSVLSPPCYVRNLPWKIKVMSRASHTQGRTTQSSLGFFLQCNGENESNSWSCYAGAELRLLSVRSDVESFTRKLQHLFCSKENDWGFSYFMAWNEVLDVKKGYIRDDTITLEVYVVADAPHGVPKNHTGDRRHKPAESQLAKAQKNQILTQESDSIGQQLENTEVNREIDGASEKVEELERVGRQLQVECNETANNQETADKNVHELEKDLRATEEQSEAKCREMEGQLELQCKVKEDALKQLKKSQQRCKEAIRDAEEARAARDELSAGCKDAERKVKSLEADVLQLTEDVSSSECARRVVEAERDELQEEMNSNENEKRRLKARIATLEEELEEKQSNNDILVVKVRLAVEQLQSLETEINKLEERLEAEAKECYTQQKHNRKLDKQLKELTMLLEEERRRANQYKEQVGKVNTRVKAVKRQWDDAEEEISKERAQKRKAQRECEVMLESHKSMTREIGNLKKRLRHTGDIVLSSSQLGTSKRGSLQPGRSGCGDDSATHDDTIDGEDAPV